MDSLVSAIFAGLMFVAGIVFAMVATPPLLSSAQASYTRCLADGAPRDNCLKYLLPKEQTP